MINIEDLIGESVTVNSLSLDNDDEFATSFSIDGKLLQSFHNERFLVELCIAGSHQYHFITFHKDKIVKMERHLDGQIVIVIRE